MNMITIKSVEETELAQPTRGHEEKPDLITLRGLKGFFLRRGLLMVSVGLIVASLYGAYGALRPPTYTSTAQILVLPGGDQFLGHDQTMQGSAGESGGGSAIDTEVEILRSRALSTRVVHDMDLVHNPHWNGQDNPPGLWASLFGRRPASGGPAPAADFESTVDAFNRSIHVQRRALSNALDVSVDSSDPVHAAELTNKLVDTYLQMQIEARVDASERATTWLARRLDELRQDVQQKEGAAADYRAQKGLMPVEGSSLTEQQTSQIQAAVLQAQADLAEREARYRQVQQLIASGDSAETIASVLDSSTIQTLRARQSDVMRREAELTLRYGDMHPALQAVHAERDDIAQQITAEIHRIAVNLANEVDVARSRLATLQTTLNGMRGDLVGDDSAQVRLRELEREAGAARQVYESFLARSHEIADQGSIQATDSRLLSPATIPRSKSAPKLRLVLVIAIGLGAALGLVAGVLVELLDDRLNSADEVERKIGLPALISVPLLRPGDFAPLKNSSRHPPGYILAKPMSGFAEAMRVLRTSILYAGIDERVQTVAVTSALPNEGKTTLAICLARIAAHSGQKVMLIDCDLRRRSLNEVLDLRPNAGLLQVLLGEADWRQVKLTEEQTGLDLLPLANDEFTPRDVFGSAAMERLHAELKASYDLIILDCPPVLAVAETRVLAALASTVALVVRWRRTPASAARAAAEQIEAVGGKVCGVALNCVDPNVPGVSSYSDALYYGQAKKAYYAD